VVVPSPELHPTAYVRGIPAVGKAIPRIEAEALLRAGLVVVKEPKKSSATKKESD